MCVFQPGADPITDAVCLDFATKFLCAVSVATGEVKLFDGETETASFAEHTGSANALALHPSRQFLVSAGEDKAIVLYDVVQKTKLGQFQADSRKSV